jgi:predicted transcriptional regulator/adenylate kinase
MLKSSAVIISLHPEHANKILSGEKKLEFRRVWATRPITAVIIYSTLPVKKIVAVAYIKQVHKGSPTKLWNLAKSIGGGLSRRTLYKYFEGKKEGYAIEFSSINCCNPTINAESLLENFHAPQSFTYVGKDKLEQIEKLLMKTNGNGKNIFVAGVHGVGKSSMCDVYAKKHGTNHKTASQLIKFAKEDALSKNGKTVKDITGNQELLITAVTKIRASGENLLLDGHFVLMNDENLLTPLPTKVFSELSIDAVIAVYDNPELIESRTKNRDGKSISSKHIDDFQNLELARAEEISKELGIPFAKIQSFSQVEFENTLNSFIQTN